MGGKEEKGIVERLKKISDYEEDMYTTKNKGKESK